MPTPRGAAGASLTQLVYTRERILYGVMVVVSLGFQSLRPARASWSMSF